MKNGKKWATWKIKKYGRGNKKKWEECIKMKMACTEMKNQRNEKKHEQQIRRNQKNRKIRKCKEE